MCRSFAMSEPIVDSRLGADTHRQVASSGWAMPGEDNPFDTILQPRHGLLTPVKVKSGERR